MHTVHLAGEGAKSASGRRLEDTAGSDGDIKIWASALGIMFDRTDYDSSITADEIAIIDKFFEQLNFEKAPPTVDSENANYKQG